MVHYVLYKKKLFTLQVKPQDLQAFDKDLGRRLGLTRLYV